MAGKHNLAIRPIFHLLEPRIFVSFIAYCLLVTLNNLAWPQAPDLTPRAMSRSSSPSRGSTSMRRPPTSVIWCWRAILGQAKTTNGSCVGST